MRSAQRLDRQSLGKIHHCTTRGLSRANGKKQERSGGVLEDVDLSSVARRRSETRELGSYGAVTAQQHAGGSQLVEQVEGKIRGIQQRVIAVALETCQRAIGAAGEDHAGLLGGWGREGIVEEERGQAGECDGAGRGIEAVWSGSLSCDEERAAVREGAHGIGSVERAGKGSAIPSGKDGARSRWSTGENGVGNKVGNQQLMTLRKSW